MKMENVQKLRMVKNSLFFMVNNKYKLFYQVLILVNVFASFLLVFFISQSSYYSSEHKIQQAFEEFLISESITKRHNGNYIIKNWEDFKQIVHDLQRNLPRLEQTSIVDIDSTQLKLMLSYVDFE